MTTHLTPTALAERWCISKLTLFRMVGRGEVEAIRIGGQLRFAVAEVERYEMERTTTNVQ